jgi:hypothetical protein
MQSPFHFEINGKSARVMCGSAAPARISVKPEARTSAGAVSSVRVQNGIKRLAQQPTAQEFIDSDPEIDLARAGLKIVDDLTTAYCDTSSAAGPSVVDGFVLTDVVTDTAGAEKERRAHRVSSINVNALDPVKVVKRFPAAQVLTQFVFRRILQLGHEDQLAYDFLYDVAKGLAEKDEIALLGAGPKGNQPLVFTEGGTAYRAFLRGEVRDEDYRLCVLLSDRELKRPA